MAGPALSKPQSFGQGDTQHLVSHDNVLRAELSWWFWVLFQKYCTSYTLIFLNASDLE